MKLFKKILCVLAVLLLAFSFAGCGEYVPPQNNEGENPGVPVTPGTPGTPTTPEDPENPEEPVDDDFTVTLKYYERIVDENGQAHYMDVPFTRSLYEETSKSFTVRWRDLQVQWTDRETKEVYRSPLSDEGVAVKKDLDGDYAVTLVSLPDGFTYEPNSYVATNSNKQIEILLYKITPLPVPGYYGSAKEKYHILRATGTYRVTLNGRDDKVFLSYIPDRQGVYSVTSMVDVTLNEVNPIMDIHKGNMPNYYNPLKFATQDGGGKENTFTKNFSWEYNISIDEVGGGFTFKIYSTCIKPDTVAYPMDIDIIIERQGEFPSRYPPSTEIEVKEDFSNTPPTPNGTFTYFVDRPGVKNNMLDEKKVKLKEEGEGSGYYYFYDAATDTYGDRLYAKITQRTEVFFDIISSYRGLNYIQATPVSEPKYYVGFVEAYASHCNADGCYPVTKELKDFLFDFARHNRRDLFNDGFGTAEKDYGYNSNEDSVWLFACGYYAAP